MELNVLSLLFVLITVVKVAESRPASDCGETGHGIVFDAGSSHTSMYIYDWPDKKTDGTGRVNELSDCDVQGGGISDYVNKPEDAGNSLQACLENGVKAIDEEDLPFTPIYLGATAGMRLVNETNPPGSAAIFDSVRKTLANTPFDFDNPTRQARIISGKDEGIFGWITTNYLSNRFKVGPTISERIISWVTGRQLQQKPTFGALDLGGASTQLTFEPEDPNALPDNIKIHKRLYGNDYTLYSNSFLCYGANEAVRRMKALLLKDAEYTTEGVENPCGHTGQDEVLDGSYLWKAPCSTGPQAIAGWGSEVDLPRDIPGISYDTEFLFKGTSNPKECSKLMRRLFQFDAPCDQPPCSFNGVHQPKPNGNFLAFSAFYYVIKGVLHTTKPTISEIDDAKGNFCAKSLTEVQNLPNYNKYFLNYCFNLHYIRILLIDGYGFDDNNWNIEFVKKVNGVSVGWTMGYMIEATNRIPADVDCTSGA